MTAAESLSDCKQSVTFQFHKGTIKTMEIECLSQIKDEFQFHKGTIKTA